MIKYSKFTDNIGSGNFTDTFCQNTDKFRKSGGVLHPPSPDTPVFGTPLANANSNSYVFINFFS